MSIFTTRDLYKPFEYPEFEQIHTLLMSSFWHAHEVTLDRDIKDYQFNLTDDERELVKRILRNFVQSEIHIGCFWGDFVASYFKKPEIQNVARYISGNETLHSFAYDYLNASLGLEEYDLLKSDKKLYARIENLMDKKVKSPDAILKQIAKYSVFGEGVALFSSFVLLFAFTKRNKLVNVGQIISWSSLDESLHSDVGCVLYNLIKKEKPELITEEFKNEIYAIAENTVKIERELLERVFDGIKVDIISKESIINYVNDRANKQLKKIGLNKKFKVDKNLLKETEFFDILVKGATVTDFFANKSTDYSRGVIVFDDSTWEN